jgi:AcrR family transcriptional regulator
MPKPTFARLPAAKRQVIIELAIAEFAAHPYAVASLSSIVARANIAKGSIYQYFDHKQDLYLFILDYAIQQQLDLLHAQVPPAAELDIFALLRWQLQASVHVGLAAPLLTQLLYRAITDDLPFRDDVMQRLHTASYAHFVALVEHAVARKEIDSSFDQELVVFVLHQLTTNFHTLLMRRLGIGGAPTAQDVALMSSPAIEQLYDQLVRLLQYGLSTQTPKRGRP